MGSTLRQKVSTGVKIGLGIFALYSLRNLALVRSPFPTKVSYQKGEVCNFEVDKAEGFNRISFRQTTLPDGNKYEVVSRYRFLRSWRYFTDFDCDGKVDQIERYGNGSTPRMTREQHYQRLPNEFDKADAFFAEVKQKFLKERQQHGIN